MNAVVSASATAAGASLDPGASGASTPGAAGRGSATQAASRPRTGTPVRGSRMWSPLRTPEALSAVWRIVSRAEHPRGLARIAQRQRPAVGARRRLERERRAEAAVDERTVEAPFLQQLRHQIDRVALADATEIESDATGGRAHDERLGVDLQRRQSGADRDVERAVGQIVDVPCDEEAFERGLTDARALSRRQVTEPGDVAVGAEAAQLAFEAIDEREGRLRGLRGVSCVGVRDVDLEHRVHGLVREAPKTGLAVSREPDPAVEVHVSQALLRPERPAWT